MTDTIRLVTKLIFIGFHGLSSSKSLTPNQWVGPTRNLAVTLVMSANLILLIITQFRTKRQGKNEHFGPFQEGGVYIPKLKHGVLTPILIKGNRMNKKLILFIGLLGILTLCVGVFYWHTQRQANYAKTRELFSPLYEYSGRLTPEEQKRFSELAHSIELKTFEGKGYALPEREQLQLEVHSMTLYRNNPELFFIRHGPLPTDVDVEPYMRYFSILALIAKTKLADLPTDSRRSLISHLEMLEKRLTKNSVEIYLQEVQDLPFRPRQELPTMRFGIASAGTRGGDQWVLEADGSLVFPEGAKRGIVHITDTHGNEYTVDLDTPTDTSMTENTTELYAEIDWVFERLTDAELRRLSTLDKAKHSATIQKLFQSE